MIGKVFYISALLLDLLTALYGLAQPQNISFKHLTINDGLSQNAVSAILQDHQGFMWFGTKDGLNRHDGYSFTVYQHNPFDSTSLSANYVTALFEDRRGTIWIGTADGGLNCLQRETGSFQRLHNRTSRSQHFNARLLSLSNQEITAMAEDSAGALWIGTRGDGLLRIVPDSVQASGAVACTRFVNVPDKANSLSSNSINALRVDGSGTLWIGTMKRLDRFRHTPDGNGFEHFTVFTKNPQAPPSPRDSSVAAIYEDRQGKFWLGTSSGISLFDRNSGRYNHFPHHYEIYRYGWGIVNGIVEDQAGQLWLATPGELMRFNPADHSYNYFRNDPLAPKSLSYNNVSSLWRDRSGVLWFGTAGGGINVFDPKTRRFSLLVRPQEPSSRVAGFSVRSILEGDSGALWISTDVLYRWNRKTGVLKSFETSSNRPDDFGNTGAWSMLQSAGGAIWCASHQGLFRYEPQSGKTRQYKFNPADTSGLRQKEVYAVFEDRDGKIWIATENYFSQLVDVENGRFRHFRYRQTPPNNELIRPIIYQDAKGRFWLGAKDGLLCFDLDTKSFQTYRNDPRQPTSLSNNEIKSICPDPQHPDSILWLGTAGGGLNCFDLENKTFRHYTERDGLPNNTVYGILPDGEGSLWLSTNKGLSRFNRVTGAFRNYDVRDGLQSNEFNTGAYYKSKSGEMFWGGISGLNYFYPADMVDNPHAPAMAITRCKILNQSASRQDSTAVFHKTIFETSALTLSHRDNIITFEFAALDFSTPEKNQYAYKMENFDKDWIHAGTARSATYSNLPPGEYIFRVKGSNNDGVWNKTGASVKLTITPPWWKTWWAYTLYVLLFTSLLYLARRYELNRLRLKNRLQIEHVETAKLREVDQMKSRFFANISHEFRTPLTLILGQIDSVLGSIVERENQSKLEVASRNARRLQRLINQLLDLSKLEAGSMALKTTRANLVSFLKSLMASFEHLAEQKGITLQFHSTRTEIALDYDPEKLEKVFYNLLSNAFKFTSQGGKIFVTVTTEEKTARKDAETQRIRKELSWRNLGDFVPARRDDNNFVEISVKDSGGGIALEHLPHVFDRFYQADTSTSSVRNYEGTGIGLALAKELVELHRGEISVTSEVGKGSEFVVKLPLSSVFSEQLSVNSNQYSVANDQEQFIDPGIQQSINPKIQPSLDPSIQPSTEEIVLFVEDSADIRTYVREQLQSVYRVIEAADGEEGLAQAREAIPDLIITDVMMPKMDGYQMSRELKHDDKTSHIPIIMLTAKAALDDKIAGLETGVDDYLLKPFSAKELLARVRNLISLRRQLRKRFSTATVIKTTEVAATSVDEAFLQRVLAAIEAHISDEHFGVEELAQAVNMSSSQINRKLHGLIDQPASQLIRSMRLQRAADLLKQNTGTVAEIAYQVGFSDQAHFARSFKKQFGCAPSEFRKKQEGA